jgi:hypothetical protein
MCWSLEPSCRARPGRRAAGPLRASAVRQGVELVRLDFWARGDRALIRYEQRGYTVDGPVVLNGWRGVVLRRIF